jgi:hypothetical protein
LALGLGFFPPLPPATTTKLAYLLLNFILLRALPLGFFFALSYFSTLGVYFLTFHLIYKTFPALDKDPCCFPI